MKKEALSIVIATILALNVATAVKATDDTVDGNLESKKQEFNILSDDLKQLDEQISELKNDIVDLNNTIDRNKQEVESVNDEIENTNLKMETLKVELEEVENTLSKRVRAFYKSNTTGVPLYLEFLFESKSFSDLFTKINSMSKIVELDNKLMDEQEEKRLELEKSVKELNTKKKSIEDLNSDTQNKLNELKLKETEFQTSKEELNSKLESVQGAIEQNEENLVAKYIDIINSGTASEAQLRDAVNTLEQMKKQITSQSVIDKMEAAIISGQAQLAIIEENSNINNNNNNENSNGNDSGNNSENDNSGESSKTYTMEATAYSGGGLTAMGTVPVRDPNGLSTVAVDPSVIPLGSKVFVEGYGYAIAADTGGAIKGMKIDLYMNSHEECVSFGRRKVTVHLME